MKKTARIRCLLLLVALLILGLIATALIAALRPQITDPHKGQVYIYDGFDWIWMTPLEGVEVNKMTAADFSWQERVPIYGGTDYEVLRGVDVSEHQNEIDWNRVAGSGVDFAFIRIGWRGYSEGGLNADNYYQQNIEGALASGLEVGVYFFSQAISVQEAIEEAEFALKLLEPYQDKITLPVVYDWEKIYDDSSARTAGLPASVLSDCAVAFCETVKNAGYTPSIYFNRNSGYYGLDLTRMTDYLFWFALPESTHPSFYYKVDIWQYSFTETVPGINTPTDMNLYFRAKA